MGEAYRLPDGSVAVPVGAGSEAALRAEARAIACYLRDRPSVSPVDVAATLARTRPVRPWRVLVSATTSAELVSALDAVADGVPHERVVTGARAAGPRRIGLVCPGQGAQWPGMGRAFLAGSAAYRQVVDECEEILRREHGVSVRGYLLGDVDPDGPEAGDVVTVQPALLTQMVGVAATWRSLGVAPDAVLGHSQGEIAAAHLAGAITLEDALRAVVVRARLASVFGRDEHRMAFLATSPSRCAALLARTDAWAELTVVNSPQAVCVSGDRAAVAGLVAGAAADGTFAREIAVTYPAHTSRMHALRDDLIAGLQAGCTAARFEKPVIDCFTSALAGDPLPVDIEPGRYWFLNLRNVVRFDRAVGAALDAGVDLFVEASAHPTLAGPIADNAAAAGVPADVVATSSRTADGMSGVTRALAEIAVADSGFDWGLLRTPPPGPPPLPLEDFPHTVLDERPMWAVRGPAPVPAAAPPAPAPAPGDRPRRLVETWVPLRRRTMTTPTRVTLVDPTGRCADLASAIAAQGPRHGSEVRVHDRLGDPGCDPTADTVLVLLPAVTGEATDELAGFLAAADRWLPAVRAATRAWIVTTGGERVRDDDAPEPFAAAAAVAARCTAADHGARLAHLDLDGGTADGALAAVHTAGEAELALRDGVPHAKRLARADETTDDGDLGEVVVTGGTGRLGLACAAELVRRGARHVTLLNRSGEHPVLRPVLEPMRRSAATVDVVACDLTDPDAVDAFARARERPVTLLLHAAVDYVHAADPATAAAGLARAAAAKVTGFEHLVHALPLDPHARVVCCSSVAATFGGPGLSVYAATNRMLDTAADRLRRIGIDTRSVQWGVWRGPETDAATGSDTDTDTDTDHGRILAGSDAAGITPMDAGAALDAGLTASPGNSLVLSADWTVLRSVTEVLGTPELLDPALVVAPAAGPAGDPAPDPAGDPAPGHAVTPDGIRAVVAGVMGLAGTDALDPDTSLVALGLDSLQALELHKAMARMPVPGLSVADILRGASLGDVVARATSGAP
ncbi:SDR family NAD(P)-dependent oxidoreductase [Pseudonocardia endophytica]|uniref:Mycobactin polyketide synthetase MbtD n=1 Tax=Pseudonocardia endophytica TaxID=401976 RepID=A0A4R1HT89_PSEEN|nr:SDR family NAD(P)-dependent oxidoreductase [Pseudonocardia endophytica]TCK24581.1 mycobactin polyketide synthetase MbtD [Pseudonocardia endophytica]